jgi:hypothetical protein
MIELFANIKSASQRENDGHLCGAVWNARKGNAVKIQIGLTSWKYYGGIRENI